LVLDTLGKPENRLPSVKKKEENGLGKFLSLWDEKRRRSSRSSSPGGGGSKVAPGAGGGVSGKARKGTPKAWEIKEKTGDYWLVLLGERLLCRVIVEGDDYYLPGADNESG